MSVPKFNAKLIIKCEMFVWDWYKQIGADPQIVTFPSDDFNDFEIITCDKTPDDLFITIPIIHEERERTFAFAVNHNSFSLSGRGLTFNHFTYIGEITEDPKNNKVLYECDRRCSACHDKLLCYYTTDIAHAKNFEYENGGWVEV